MFTGLVKEVGTVLQVNPNTEGKRITIGSKILIEEMSIDDSVLMNGVCQTIVKVSNKMFEVQAVHTTIDKTTLGNLKPNSKVNLELALRPIDRLGGHIVQGHVNGVGTVQSIRRIGENYNINFKLPREFFRFIISEGSIAIDGISLTVAAIDRHRNICTTTIIPHTLNNTTFAELKTGDKVNIEVDMIAKYIDNLLVKDKISEFSHGHI